MIVTLLKQDALSSIFLKGKKDFVVDPMTKEKLICITKSMGQYILKSTKNVKIIDDVGCNMENVRLKPYHLYHLYKKDTDENFVLLSEPMNADIQTYKKYRIIGNEDIRIGRERHLDICFQNALVSAKHAGISVNSGNWMLYDENSVNGIYVNDKRVFERCKLKAGDRVYIMGLRMIIGKSFLAINNPEESVILNEKRFVPYRQ